MNHKDSLYSVIGKIAGTLSGEHFPPGDRALLKRLHPKKPPPVAFYRIAVNLFPEGWERHARAWRTIVGGIALMAPAAHDPHKPLGAALARVNFSEARLERLFAAEDDVLSLLVLRVARFLAAKNTACNWVDFAALLLSGDEKQEAIRLRIARDYYKNLPKE